MLLLSAPAVRTVVCSLISHSLFPLRHFYKPMLVKGVNKLTAQVAVFFLSAFFHEVSLHTYIASAVYSSAVK